MKLMMVVFLDNEEFLVDTEGSDIPEEYAVTMAMIANRSSDVLGQYDDDLEDEINDRSCYTAFAVEDMDMLANIIKRDDYLGVVDDVIVFNG